MPEIKHSYYLKQALNFTDADLKANRKGYLTDKQKKSIRGKNSESLRNWLIILLITALFFLLFAYDDPTSSMTLILCVIPALLIVAAQYFDQFTKVRNELKANKVQAETGVIWKNPKYMDNGIYRISIGQDAPEFEISQEIFYLLKDGEVYTVYQLPKSNIILSIERPDRADVVREIKDELKYLDAKQAELKAKNDEL